MRLRSRRPGTRLDEDRGSAAERVVAALGPILDASRGAVSKAREIVPFEDPIGSPLVLGYEESDSRFVGGTGLAARALQLVPRCEWEPNYEEGVR
jgi:hypothetical protein